MRFRSFVSRYYKAVKETVSVSADFYIALSASILLLPLPWLCAWALSTFVHEICHYIAIRCCGKIVYGIQISLKGVYMQTEGLSERNEALCAYAGPAGALLLLFLARKMPRVAICVVVQSLYNLIPVFPLDGGRGLFGILLTVLGTEKGIKVFSFIEKMTLLILSVLALYAYLKLGLGLLPAVIAIFIFVKNKKINMPCKKGEKGLQ